MRDWLDRIPAACLAALLLTGCAPPRNDPPEPRSRRTDHVVLISIDGLRGDALVRFEAPTIRTLASEGSFTFDATTVVPSTTLPSHASMLTGVSPAVHGITWNVDRPDWAPPEPLPTIFSATDRAGLEGAAFFAKGKLRQLTAPGAPAYVAAPPDYALYEPGTRVVAEVQEYLSRHEPHLLFIHLADLDAAGHTMGWMSHGYEATLRQVDVHVRAILDAAAEAFGAARYTVILTADHGGSERGHGSDAAEELRIPWIAWGHGVVTGHRLEDVRVVDTAPTVLWLLGVRAPGWTEGAPVEDAFRRMPAAP